MWILSIFFLHCTSCIQASAMQCSAVWRDLTTQLPALQIMDSVIPQTESSILKVSTKTGFMQIQNIPAAAKLAISTAVTEHCNLLCILTTISIFKTQLHFQHTFQIHYINKYSTNTMT